MKILISVLISFITFSALAQDKIIKKSGNIIECKVSELAADEIKYFYTENPKLVFGIDKALVEKVEFSTGEVIEIEKNSYRNTEYYVNQNKHALKINFMSPLFGSTEFVYEQSIKPGRSWETALGIIGLGWDPQNINPKGVFGKFALKFMKDPDFYMHRMHYAHILKGAYFAPEIATRYVSYDYNVVYRYGDVYFDRSSYYNIKKREKFSAVLLLKFGKQWIFEDSFLIDIYGGIGYGIGGDDMEPLNYGFIVAPDEAPFAISGGVRIGWVFKK